MTDGELDMVQSEVRRAMRRVAEITRDQCAQYVRQFGGRVGNEYLAKMIGRMPLPGDFSTPASESGTDDV